MKEMIMILISVVLVNNFVLSQFLGVCPFLGVSKKLDSAVGMSAAVTFVMVLATAVTWPVMHLILVPQKIAYLQTVVFILVIASLVQLVEMILKKHSPGLHKSLGVYLPLITTNCAVLGADWASGSHIAWWIDVSNVELMTSKSDQVLAIDMPYTDGSDDAFYSVTAFDISSNTPTQQ